MSDFSGMQSLIGILKAKGYVKSSVVEAVMLSVDRSHYCPSSTPYADTPHQIGYGATISAPHMHAFALEAAKDCLVEGAKVLDVGSGSGYLTSCLAHMVGHRGTVFGVDHIRELVEQSRKSIHRDNPELLSSGRVKLFVADGRDGLPDFAPFDVIHVGATAPELPAKLVEQLRVGGIMLLPIQRGDAQMFESMEKLANGELRKKQLLQVRYVPLTDAASQLRGDN